MSRLPESLELRCRVAAQLAGLSFGGWVERTLRLASDEALELLQDGEAVVAQARDRWEGGMPMVAAVQGLDLAPPRAPPGSVDVAQILASLVAGETEAEIAERLHLAPQTVERARRRAGVHLRDTPAPPVEDALLRRLHAEGLATAEIARRTGLTLGSARTRLSRLGLRDNARSRR